PDLFIHGNTTGGRLDSEHLKLATELLITTGEAQYAKVVEQLLQKLEQEFAFHVSWFVRARPHMSPAYGEKVKALTATYVANVEKLHQENQYGVRATAGAWAGSRWVMLAVINSSCLHRASPDLVDREALPRGLNFLYSTHPEHNLSLASAVGSRTN